mgnify:CR=1 FL=1
MIKLELKIKCNIIMIKLFKFMWFNAVISSKHILRDQMTDPKYSRDEKSKPSLPLLSLIIF